MTSFSCLGIAALLLAVQQPVFRSGVDLVTVDVGVLNSRGDPLEGLTADRFEITVDGSPRRVVSAEFVPHRTGLPASSSALDHVTSNEGLEAGRLILIAVDQMHIRRVEGLAALRAAASFINSLEPADHVAVTPIDYGGPIRFTTEHATVKRYLQTLTGTAAFMPVHFNIGLSEALAIADGSRTRLNQVVIRECGQSLARYENPARIAEADGLRDPCPVQVEQEGRAVAQRVRTEARLTLDALARLIARLGEIEGPKTLVLLSEGFVAEPQLIDLTSLGAAAQAARVTIHVLQLETPVLDASSDSVSPTLYLDLQLRADGLARLAGSARGGMFHLVGDDPHPFRRITREISAHYLIAFEASAADRDGRVHRIGVKVRGSGLTVRGRPAFRIPAGRAAAAPETGLVRLLRDPRIATELPLRLASYVFRETEGDRLHVLIASETELTRGQEATAGFVLVDGRGVIAASGGGTTQNGRYEGAASVPRGRYTLKAAAIDASGRRGSVERRVNAETVATGGVEWSDLMLAEPPPDPSMPLSPLVGRAAGERAVAYLEAYAAPAVDAASVRAEMGIASDSAAPPLVTAAARVRRTASGRLAIVADIPLDSLPPGTYLIAMRVTIPNVPPQQFTRRFVVTR